MIIERSMHPQFLSNTYLVAAGQGGEALFVDAGGPMEPLFEAVDRLGGAPAGGLLTPPHLHPTPPPLRRSTRSASAGRTSACSPTNARASRTPSRSRTAPTPASTSG